MDNATEVQNILNDIYSTIRNSTGNLNAESIYLISKILDKAANVTNLTSEVSFKKKLVTVQVLF